MLPSQSLDRTTQRVVRVVRPPAAPLRRDRPLRASKNSVLHRAALGATSVAPDAARDNALYALRGGGGERNRTDDLLLAKQALSQLSYTPSYQGGRPP